MAVLSHKRPFLRRLVTASAPGRQACRNSKLRFLRRTMRRPFDSCPCGPLPPLRIRRFRRMTRRFLRRGRQRRLGLEQQEPGRGGPLVELGNPTLAPVQKTARFPFQDQRSGARQRGLRVLRQPLPSMRPRQRAAPASSGIGIDRVAPPEAVPAGLRWEA